MLVLKSEAQKFRYGRWAGNPDGTSYDEARCAWEVGRNYLSFYQCSRKNGHGPEEIFCKQHARIYSISL